MKVRTVVIYVRLSRDSDTSTSVESQIAACKAYAKARGWRVLFVAEPDVDISGASRLEDRPGMSQVLDSLGEADFVLAAKLDRYARSVLEFSRLLRAAEEAGTTLITADGTLNPDTSKLVVHVLSAFAEYERDMIKARISASKSHLRTVGRWLGGAAPYGYKLVKRDAGTYLEIDQEAQEVILDCVDKLLNKGYSFTGLAHELNENKTLSPADHARKRDGRKVRGTKWSCTTVRDVLITPALRGFLLQAAPGKPRSARYLQPVLDAQGNPHQVGPEILDAETHGRVRGKAESRSLGQGAKRTGKAALLHVAQCAECRHAMYRQKRVVEGKDYSTYVCPKGVGKRGEHASNIVQAAGLDQQAESEFLKRFGAFSLMSKVKHEGRDVARELQDTDEALDNLSGNLEALPAGGRAAQTVISKISTLEAKRVTLVEEAAKPVRTEWVDTGRKLAEEWGQRTSEGRNNLLRDFGAVVSVSPLPKTAERRFSESRAVINFTGPEWWRDRSPEEAHLEAIARDEILAAA
ncbi:recombinase family protein [Streptomyces bauhiniae]|uniref:recombinase family protein n=1 Tax=Streptomyces bauhiniae TaxID=2340725 RepID=UPI003656DE55